MSKSIVLLSGGLDSTVSFKRALDVSEVIFSLTFDYGQKAAAKEIAAAQRLSERYKICHRIIELPWYREVLDIALVAQDKELPRIKDFSAETTKNSARQVWAYNRNGLFINIAAVFAEKNNCDYIVTGFNVEEAATFPDNSLEFCNAITKSLAFSTLNHPQVLSYTQKLTKTEIAKWGREIGVDFDSIWSCYLGGEKMCGKCESCQRFKKALAANNLLNSMENRFADPKLIH